MTPLIKSGQEHVLSPINLSDVEVGDIVFCKVKGRYYTHLVKVKGDRGVLIGNNHGNLTKSVEDIEAGITVTFSDGVTPVTMEYLTNEINNAHYRLSITSRYITVNHGYGQLYPLVKRIDYERTIQEMARETSM